MMVSQSEFTPMRGFMTRSDKVGFFLFGFFFFLFFFSSLSVNASEQFRVLNAS